jgi:hypothetical protein
MERERRREPFVIVEQIILMAGLAVPDLVMKCDNGSKPKVSITHCTFPIVFERKNRWREGKKRRSRIEYLHQGHKEYAKV